ncbi:MAG: T9SS type A sorting domain-containing protein [Ignavibacteria bacterium]|nr:T9SS type A sorting domain-containing protein [Ignavibacteria bacterium]
MKKVLLLPLLLCSLFYVNSFSQVVNIPDVMGISNPKNQITSPFDVTSLVDTLPPFPGFPKVIAGTTFEGAIYCNMDSDPDLEIVININTTILAFNKDGSNVAGWPVNVGTQPLQGAPAFGDIDGDGQEEIVCVSTLGSTQGRIYAYKKNGTAVTGFPITHGYSARTPVLADLNNDGKLEIIVNKRLSSAGEVWVYKGDGTVYSGWPKPINHVPASSSAVGDITGDGIPEIIAESYTSLYAWDRDGNLLNGFPFVLPGDYKNSYSSPVLADVNNDNIREIIFGSQSQSGTGCVHIIRNDGTVYPNWPKITDNWVYTAPAVGLINNDNVLDIAVGDQVLSGTPIDKLYCWDVNGNSLAGFPVNTLNAINSQILIGDIDNDNNMELIIDDNTRSDPGERGQYLAYNHDGTPVSGWPIQLNGWTMFNVPCLTDIDRNGILDIIGSGQTGFGATANINLYLWNTGKNYTASKIVLPVFQYNVRHDGVYNKPSLVSTGNNGSFVTKGFELKQNYPNPFNPSTTINYSIPKPEFVKLCVYDLLGKEVASLVNEIKGAGSYEFNFNALNLSSGIYVYKISAGDFSASKQMILIK